MAIERLVMSMKFSLIFALIPLHFCGCQSLSHTENGALTGAAVGGVGGTILGAAAGNPQAGAVLGAMAGGLTGGAIGHAEDQREAREAVAQARFDRDQVASGRLGMTDVVTLSQQGTDADVIVNQIRNTRSTFNLSTADLQYLTQQNVSPKVISAMQSSRPSPRMVVREEPYYPPPAIVIERPWPYPCRPYGWYRCR